MFDYIIVGAGLAGISVAEELQKKGRSFIVYENESQSSSTVAGGVFNPVILKRFTPAWNAGEQLETAIPFYRSLEKKLGVELIEDLPIYRKFSSIEEQNNWFDAMDKPLVSPFLDPHLEPSVNENIPSDFSFGRVKNTGRIDTPLLLESYRNYLLEKGLLLTEDFEYDRIGFRGESVTYKEYNAGRIIFCEGFGITNNIYFNFLPVSGNKGEYLIIRAADLKLNVAVKSSVFILPLGRDLYKVGATYDNTDISPKTSSKARETLLGQLQKIISCDFEVIDQVAGIRPASRDRKPVVGQHPEHPELYCCNGFGSRGVLVAPAVAKDLVNFLEEKAPLPEEIDLRRFLKRAI